MNDHDDLTPAQAALIEKRIDQTFAFVGDLIDDPGALEEIPDGSRLTFRDVEIQQIRVRLTAYPAKDHIGGWIARVTGPAALAARWRSSSETRVVAGKWGSPLTGAVRGETAEAALDALEDKLPAAEHSGWILRHEEMRESSAKSKNKRKGEILEDVVALLHDDPDVVVEKRVKLSSLTNPKRNREIDVLATGLMLGRQMRLAFECKNYGAKIGIGKIEEFSGRLQDVGIPTQHGIFVTAGDYTVDARQRAKALGIRLLRLDGLTADRLSAEVHAAFQSIIYLLAVVKSVTVTCGVDAASAMDVLFLKNADGRWVGGVPDLIWAKWRDGMIPTQLGEHHLEMGLPEGWNWVFDGAPAEAKAEAVVSVEGVIATQTGQAHRLMLRDADTDMVDRARIGATFEEEEPGKIVMSVDVARTESELAEKLNNPGIARAHIGRIPLPRILYNCNLYWPPSLRVSLALKEKALELEKQGKWSPGVFASLSLAEVEGTDLSAIWDEITPEHPAAHDPHWPWFKKRSRGRIRSPRVQPKRRRR